MSFEPVTGGRAAGYAGTVVPYAQPGPMVLSRPQGEIDVYVPEEHDESAYRFAEPSEVVAARQSLIEILDYYADHQLWGWPVFYTKSSVAERLRDFIRECVMSDVLFAPEQIFDPLAIKTSRHVKSTKHHWQNLLVDRKKDETQHQRDSRMELEVLRIWAKCVDEVTSDLTDNPNARALCSYADHLVANAQSVLFHSNGGWTKKMASRLDHLRASLTSTIEHNEMAYQDVYGGGGPEFAEE